MPPILYRLPVLPQPTYSRIGLPRRSCSRKQFSPDLCVAFVPEHPRQSFDSEREGGFPPVGARSDFDVEHEYRRNGSNVFDPWLPDVKGPLWSETLDLFLAVHGSLLQAQTADGWLLLTPE